MSTYDPIALGVTVGLDAIRADAASVLPDVRHVHMTCGACPSQWDVQLTDDSNLYVRYRWGTFTVSHWDGEHLGDPFVVASVGSDFDGIMPTGEMLDLLRRHGVIA